MNSPPPVTIAVRPLSVMDLDRVLPIEEKVFTAPWSRQAYEEMLALETVCAWVATANHELVGYVLCQVWGDELELHTIGVASAWQQRGVGRRLMEVVIEEAKLKGVTRFFLLVRPSNTAALSLYASFGFAKIGVRRRYYRDNDEDALVMRRQAP